ncbi:MAG: hypothetical protein AAF502_21040 [Bacteroidota bacterium]
MKTLIIFLMAMLPFCPSILSQPAQTSNQTVDQIIGGSEVVVELFKALNSKKKNRQKKGKDFSAFGKLCFQNTSDIPVKVKLENLDEASNVGVIELVIPVNGKECSLRTVPGIYMYSIIDQDEEIIIRKGELIVEPSIDQTKVVDR